MNYRNFLIMYLFILIYLSLSSAPEEIIGEEIWDFSHSDKVKHFIAYSILSFLFIKAYKQKTKYYISFSFIASVCIGCVLEILQYFFGRQFELWDILVNSLSAALVCFFMKNYIFKFNKIQK